MTRWMLSNGNGRDVFPASEEELVHGLSEMDALAQQEAKPRLAVLIADADADDAPYLSIGLGSDESVLVYEGNEAQGGYSKGTHTDDDSTMFFAYGTGTSEFLGWMAIPRQQAIEAARQFFRTGRQPTSVEWVDL